jgi:hypothetical protein
VPTGVSHVKLTWPSPLSSLLVLPDAFLTGAGGVVSTEELEEDEGGGGTTPPPPELELLELELELEF